METKEVKVICDKCNNFEVSMCGTYEICHAKKEGSKFIKWIDDLYANERMNGNKQTCKGFKKIN